MGFVGVKWFFAGVVLIVIGVEQGGGRGVRWGVWLVGGCLEDGKVIGWDFVSSGLMIFVKVMVGSVGVIRVFVGIGSIGGVGL